MRDIGMIEDLLNHWKLKEADPNYDPSDKTNTTIESNTIVQVLLYKLQKMKMDVIFPSEALCILVLCIARFRAIYKKKTKK